MDYIKEVIDIEEQEYAENLRSLSPVPNNDKYNDEHVQVYEKTSPSKPERFATNYVHPEPSEAPEEVEQKKAKVKRSKELSLEERAKLHLEGKDSPAQIEVKETQQAETVRLLATMLILVILSFLLLVILSFLLLVLAVDARS